MIKAINNNRYFKFFQPKLFYVNQNIDRKIYRRKRNKNVYDIF